MIYVLGGGGQGKGPIKKGTIVVTYPSGATCTVTNGSQTYTALDTSGAAAFIVEPGEWTVTAVQGSESASESVTVTAGGWVEVELEFTFYLYKSGNEYTSITGGFSVLDSASGILNKTDEYMEMYISSLTGVTRNDSAWTNDKVSLSEIRTLKVKAKAVDGTTSFAALAIHSSKVTSGVTTRVTINNSQIATLSLDVSAHTGEWYVGFQFSGRSDIPMHLFVYELWGEK